MWLFPVHHRHQSQHCLPLHNEFRLIKYLPLGWMPTEAYEFFAFDY